MFRKLKAANGFLILSLWFTMAFEAWKGHWSHLLALLIVQGALGVIGKAIGHAQAEHNKERVRRLWIAECDAQRQQRLAERARQIALAVNARIAREQAAGLPVPPRTGVIN